MFVLLTLGLVAVVPIVFDALPLGALGRVLAQVVRWVALVVVVVVALAVVYRIAPDRDAPRFRWVSVGALVATVLWVLGSVGFSLYVNFFGNYNKTYGAVAGVVVLMLWLYLTSYIVLLGAEINAESERQTRRDTTRGPARPMGARGADAADTVAGEPGPPRRIESGDNGYHSGMTSQIRGAAGSPPERSDVQSATTSELVTRLSTQVSDLVRGELTLARSELQAKGKRLGAGAGLGGGAGVLAVGGLLAFLTAAIAALALVLPVWASALIVGVVLLIIAAVLGLLGPQADPGGHAAATRTGPARRPARRPGHQEGTEPLVTSRRAFSRGGGIMTADVLSPAEAASDRRRAFSRGGGMTADVLSPAEAAS